MIISSTSPLFSLGAPFSNRNISLQFFTEIRGFSNVYIIKGAPGLGKEEFIESSALKYLKNGCDVQIIYNIDGTKISAVINYSDSCAIIDSEITSDLPPFFFSSLEHVVDFNSMSDRQSIAPHRAKIGALFDSMAGELRCTRRYLGAICEVKKDIVDMIEPHIQKERLYKLASRIIKKELRFPMCQNSDERKRYFVLSQSDIITSLVKHYPSSELKIYALEDEYGVSDFLLKKIREHLLSTSLTFYSCYSMLNPESLEGIIIPKLSVVFIRSLPLSENVFRKINLNRYVSPDGLRAVKNRLKFDKRLINALTCGMFASLEYLKEDEKNLKSIFESTAKRS